MKNIFILILFSCLSISYSQNLKKEIFEETNWFSGADSIDLAKKDTITIFKIKNIETKNENLTEYYVAYFYSKLNLRVTKFKKENDLQVQKLHLLQCGFVFDDLYGKWNFDDKNQILTFTSEGMLNSSYRIIARKEERANIETEFKTDKIIFTTDLETLVLTRLK
ncbi:hypothetical protein [Flavobacterium chungnamense]|uniref:Lipocalin-like domain-containing protein n=1 Tax=Flavobacterium chungnamense TaxID=706182 RepID=A0ABP7UFN3_9FLAO